MASITISHTRAEGTVLDGSAKGDGVYEIVKDHGFRWSRHVGIYIRNSRDKEAQHWRINGAKAALEAAGHEVTVEINEGERRTFAEAEADREERAEDRAERFGDRAGRAVASADARRATADNISRRFEFGQPILVGHHSEGKARRDAARIDANMRKSFEERDRASYWANRAAASEGYAEFRNNPQRTLRRLEKLRADLRAQERYRDQEKEAGREGGRHERLILDLTEEIEYWERVVAKAEAEGVKIWGPADFVAGDFVRTLGSWYEIERVNPKTLSIAWNLRLAPKQVMTCEDATDRGRVWTHTVDYTKVSARCPGDAMRAFMADGKVPGTKSAAEASEQQPASALREAEAANPKPKKKSTSDPKVPKKVFVECPIGGAEATMTWWNGGSRPHKDFQPVKLTPPDGEKFNRTIYGRNLRGEVARVLAEHGYECGPDDWALSRDRSGYVRTIKPVELAPVEPEPAPAEPEPAPEPEELRAAEPEPEPETPKIWGRADFKKGDFVQTENGWFEVTRANPRSVSVPGEPYLVQWALVTGRRSAAEMAEALAAAHAEEDQAEPEAPAEDTPGADGETPEGSEKTALTCENSESTRNHTDPPSVGNSDYPLHPTTKEAPPMPATTTRARKTAKADAPAKAEKKTAAPVAPAAKPVEIKTVQKRVPVDRIDRDPSQPRKTFDPVKLEELTGSMRELGQLQPVSLRYVPGTKRYVLVLGERRWRAAQAAGITELDAVVTHGLVEGDRETLARQVAENVGRADMTPIEEAESFKRLTDAEYSIDEVSKMVGKSPAYVGWRIDLLRLCEPAREALGKGHLPVGLAWYVSLLNCDNQMRFLTRYARGEFKSTRDAEAFAQAARTEEKRVEGQGSFFVLADEAAKPKDGQESLPTLDVPAEERERITTDRTKLVGKIDKLSVAGEILSELASADPEELALLLAGTPGGVPGHQLRIEHLRELTLRATKKLREAQAIASVRANAIEINPEAAASSSAA
ncbi:hypothetical protein GCM10010387_15870 [Streptomyces inusitatus]|uniref:ParB-like N-terminal domain-containing protein n=1 Tax=Streptomyces inusitatus TaxID=68221 RepID=A0A918PUQ3_9ACTN|nr:ParB/RepB/Spo0J family partition protein [Streptomyces inusitatus]GGZ23504.1 hypothetical protein GCM10010387_15870 [Streptomyces inusitatus]